MVDFAKTSDCLAFFVSRHSGSINRTKLLKLLYLGDVLAQARCGKSITGAEYISYDHGPWFADFYKVLEGSPNIAERQAITVFGDREYLYSGAAKFAPSALSAEEVGFLEEVDARWGDKSLRSILNHVYATVPFAGTPYGQPVDLTKATIGSV